MKLNVLKSIIYTSFTVITFISSAEATSRTPTAQLCEDLYDCIDYTQSVLRDYKINVEVQYQNDCDPLPTDPAGAAHCADLLIDLRDAQLDLINGSAQTICESAANLTVADCVTAGHPEKTKRQKRQEKKRQQADEEENFDQGSSIDFDQ